MPTLPAKSTTPTSVLIHHLRRKRVNSTIYVDKFCINGNAILHVVDEATKFQAAQHLVLVTAESVWYALCRYWIDVYVGPPDLIMNDVSKQSVANSF